MMSDLSAAARGPAEPVGRFPPPGRMLEVDPLSVRSPLRGVAAAAAVARVGRAVPRLLALGLVFGLAQGAFAEPSPVPPPPAEPLPSPAELERLGATIGRILIETQDIFDLEEKGENNFLFRLANRLHPSTKAGVVRRILIVHPGDRFDVRRLAECERLLRAQQFLYDAQIVPVAWDGTHVDLEVRTRDIWSLRVGANLRHAGETTTTRFSLQDSNFLGYGKDVVLAHAREVERTSYVAGYRDRNLFGSRARLELWYTDSSDGLHETFRLDRPFYSLDARWAGGFTAERERRVDSLYRLNKRINRFHHDADFAQIYGGLSPGLVGGRSARYSVGVTYDDHEFTRVQNPPTAPPANRRLVYPWASVALVADGFETIRDLDKIDRTEDLNLGYQASFQLGWADPAFGADRRSLVYGASFADGWRPRPGLLLLYDAVANGRWERQLGVRGLLATASARLFWRDFGGHNLYVGLSGAFAHYADYNEQLLLGGDNGLRGYPQFYQDGNRRFLVTVEQRFYRPKEYFHLVRFGAAVFFDAGRCWFTGETYKANLGVLKDVGVGLRISSSRSASATMVHLDVALPLDGRRGIRGVQWLVTTSETF